MRYIFLNNSATSYIYTLSLHDALPISKRTASLRLPMARSSPRPCPTRGSTQSPPPGDRKSTRLNSSHTVISYAVFCLKKKNDSAAPVEGSKTFVKALREAQSDTKVNLH